MPNFENLALMAGFIAMLFVAASYFLPKKSLYLVFQALGMCFLALSYFFTAQYFAMVGLAVSLFRALTFYLYERREKQASIAWSVAFSLLTLAAYFLVNARAQRAGRAMDTICLAALMIYAFVFRIRDLGKLRLFTLLPTSLSVLYAACSGAAVFVSVSYAFELLANALAIYREHMIKRKKTHSVLKEYTYEKHKNSAFHFIRGFF